MKKNKKNKITFKSLTLSEKLIVIGIYAAGILGILSTIIIAYLKCPMF